MTTGPMAQVLTIQGRLDGMNEYTEACRSHWAKGAAMKRANQDAVGWAIKAARMRPHEGPVRIAYRFYERPAGNGRMRDRSNISGFAVKVIEDALVEAGILRDDDWATVLGDSREYFRASGEPRIEVEVSDA